MDRGLCSFLGIIFPTASQANRANGRPGVGRGRDGEKSSPMQIAWGRQPVRVVLSLAWPLVG